MLLKKTLAMLIENEMESTFFVRLRNQFGIREFTSITVSGEIDQDYMEPFGGVKQALAAYLMKSVSSCAIRCVTCKQTPKPWLRVSNGWLTILTAG